MHGEAGAKCVEVEDVEDFVFVHEGLGVGVDPFVSTLHSGRNATEETNDLFVYAMKGLEVCFVGL